jgi:hypothetical protein
MMRGLQRDTAYASAAKKTSILVRARSSLLTVLRERLGSPRFHKLALAHDRQANALRLEIQAVTPSIFTVLILRSRLSFAFPVLWHSMWR